MARPSPSTILVKTPEVLPNQELDDCADLTLIVGADGVRFKVSSFAMRMSSPVWKAMLTGPFIESKTKEIRLPEDLPEALLAILKIAHMKFNTLPSSMSRKLLVDLAVLCDKYDLIALIRPWLVSWCDQSKRDVNSLCDSNSKEVHEDWLFMF
jgi:hypothetical protein